MLIYMVDKININLQTLIFLFKPLKKSEFLSSRRCGTKRSLSPVFAEIVLIALEIRETHPQFHWADPFID